MPSIDERMKNYEATFRSRLIPRMPAIVRVDGKAFHTFSRGFDKPFDAALSECMIAAADALVRESGTAKLAYVQSDEISILLTDYDLFETQQWGGGRLDKITSWSASLATLNFNNCLEAITNWIRGAEDDQERAEFLEGKRGRAMFDARAFSLPVEEVGNYFYWRAIDAEKNSISALAQTMFSHKQLQGVDNETKKQMCEDEGIDWNDLPEIQKWGAMVVRPTLDLPILGSQGWSSLSSSEYQLVFGSPKQIARVSQDVAEQARKQE